MPYSPWQDAQQFGNLGVAMNRAIIGLSNARARQQQNLQMLAIRQALEQAQQRHYDVQDAETLQKLNESKASMAAAQKLADAVRAQNMPPMQMTQLNMSPGPQAPDPMGLYSVMAPTQSQAGINNAEVLAARALVAAMAGNPQHGDPQFHNIGQNDIAINSVTGEQTPGAIVLSPGGMYDMGGQKIVNPRPYFGGQGQVPYDASGKPIGPQVPFDPRPPGNAGIPSFHPNSGYEGSQPYIFDPRTMTVFPIIEPRGTNQVPRMGAPISASSLMSAPSQGSKKPTRAQAKALVDQLGREGALKQLQEQGYDISGYAD